MGRWADALRIHTIRDTVDRVDTVPPPTGPEGLSVDSVNSVADPDCGIPRPELPPRREQVSTLSTESRHEAMKISAGPVDLGQLPIDACPNCRGGVWWRVSSIEPDGPGNWCCARCEKPNAAARLDGHAVPTVEMPNA
jgi:hypothetical protein